MNEALRFLLAVSVLIAILIATAPTPQAQTIPPARIAILLAEGRGATAASDLATLRTGVRNADDETARAAIRALGRLGRAALVTDILPALRSSAPELRAEAADAIATALSEAAAPPGGRGAPATGRGTVARGAAVGATPSAVSVLAALSARLSVEDEPFVREAICEAIGRLPYADEASQQNAEDTLVALAHSELLTERLGVMKGLEGLLRRNVGRRIPGPFVLQVLREVFADASSSLHDARVRRLALEALISANQVDNTTLQRAIADLDPQVRRLAVRAVATAPLQAPTPAVATVLTAGLRDSQPMVRLEALRAEGQRSRGLPETCQHLVEASGDTSAPVTLLAIDLMSDCGSDATVVAFLEHTVNDLSGAGIPRGWHRGAHALLSLVRASPARASAALGQFTTSSNVNLRVYAARAASWLSERDALEKLANDADPQVADVARAGLGQSTVAAETKPASPSPVDRQSDINAEDLKRLASPRARIIIRDVGTIELALFASEAPASVLRFARLASTGVYDGKPIGVGASTIVSLVTRSSVDDDPVRREVGAWPHVRGTIGLSPSTGDLGDAKIFIDLVDNPRFDHEYPVLGQILNGLELVDQLLEGDVIDRVEIIP